MRCPCLAVLALIVLGAREVDAAPPSTAPAATNPGASLSVDDWREDLHALVETLASKHKNAFTKVSREQFEAAASEIDTRLDALNDWQRYIEFKRLVAMVGDAHTNIDDTKGRLPRRFYPFSVLLLKDGVCVTATTPELQSLLGSRLSKIGSTDIDAAIERVGEIVPHENHAWLLNQVRVWINSPEALAALGLIDDMEHASFTFTDAAEKETTIMLAPMPKGQGQTPAPDLTPQRLPLTLRPRATVFGSMVLPDSRDLYVWYDSCSDMKDKTVAQFAQETLDTIERDKPERIIVDLRRNGGGNSALIGPLVRGLAKRETTRDADGAWGAAGVFVLIGRNTFSSGLWAAEDFKKQAHAVVVGGPTGGRPNSFGEVRSVQLPHSGFTLHYSTKKWTRDPDSDPDSLEPDVLAESTYADLIAGRDVAIDAAREYAKQP